VNTAPVPPAARPLTGGQVGMLVAATLPMIAAGAAGAWGTYTNIRAVFPQSATALGVVAAGEGATLVLALVYVGLTMLGQSSPAAVRLGLWVLPAVASGTGAVVARGSTSAVVYAVTPMAMCVSAEGIGLLARRIVVRTTGVDMEAQRRNAATMQRLAYQRARAANHPDARVKERAQRKAWRLARKVGVDDTALGVQLVAVQRERMTEGADAALAAMFTPAVTPGRDAIESVTETVPTAVTESVTEGETPPLRGQLVTPDAGTATEPVTQVSPGVDAEPAHPVTPTVTLADLAAVAGVTTPVPADRMTDPQLMLVLRYLRYQEDPPLSYRQAVGAFREQGYVGSEQRVRKAWGELMSQEEAETPTAPKDAS
jgi:hypothetical protein